MERNGTRAQCIGVIKRGGRTPSYQLVDSRECVRSLEKQILPSSVATLFLVEVIEEDASHHLVKIHYTGYSAKSNAWVCKNQIQFKPKTFSLTPCEDLQSCDFATLACCIKFQAERWKTQ